jgi:hypothetical protein
VLVANESQLLGSLWPSGEDSQGDTLNYLWRRSL